MSFQPAARPLLTLCLAVAALAMPGCAGTTPPTAPPTRAEQTVQVGLGSGSTIRRALVKTVGGGSFSGMARLSFGTPPFLADNGLVLLQTRDISPMSHALVTATTLGDALYTDLAGNVISTLTDQEGRFAFADSVPVDTPFIVRITLAGGHTLSAIARAGQIDRPVDEATSMVAEMIRANFSEEELSEGAPLLADVKPETLDQLDSVSRSLLEETAVTPTAGTTAIPNLLQGAAAALRCAYVGQFGSQIDTRTSPTDADRLSDLWREVLGFRPLALTPEVGNGTRGSYDEGSPALESGLLDPLGAAADAAGNLYLAEPNNGRVRMVPAKDRPKGYLGYTQAMKAGGLYTVAGVTNGPINLAAFNAVYGEAETAARNDDGAAPAVYDAENKAPYPLFGSSRLAVESLDDGANVFFSSPDGRRVLLLPHASIGRYGRHLEANRVYTLAGTGESPRSSAAEATDGQAAVATAIGTPTGLTLDSEGNVFFIDASREIGALRVVRASDGKLFSLPLTLGGSALSLSGASDLKLTAGWLYMALPTRHVVLRCAVPDIASLKAGAVASIVAEKLLGEPDKPGFAATTGTPFSLGSLAAGMAATATRLDTPQSLAIDAKGGLYVADRGRVRFLAPGPLTDARVFLVAGGPEASQTRGDARLTRTPEVTAMALAPDGNLLLLDRTDGVLRRLWVARGL